MTQIEKNKAELWADIQQLADHPLNPSTASTLVNYMAIYDALCRVSCSRSEKVPAAFENSEAHHFNRKMAMEWAADMKNADGTQGPHFSMEKTTEIREAHKVDCDPVLFWIAMNVVYSDGVAVAKKHNVNTIDYYVDMANAWINDPDAVPDKAMAYYTNVVKH